MSTNEKESTNPDINVIDDIGNRQEKIESLEDMPTIDRAKFQEDPKKEEKPDKDPQLDLNNQYVPFLPYENFDPNSQIVIKEFICPLCKGVLNDPVEDEFGSMFCIKCLTNYLKTNNKSIVTNQPYTKSLASNSHSMSGIWGIISKQIIFCKNKVNGCEWKGSVKDYEPHLTNQCLKEMIHCRNHDCVMNVLRENLNAHLEKCPYRLVKCQDCQVNLPYISLEFHKTVCPNFKTECPQKCKKLIMRCKIDEHLLKECSKSPVDCPFKEIGCKEKILREEIKKHFSEYKTQHSKMFTEKIFRMKSQIPVLLNSLVEKHGEKISKSLYKIIDAKFLPIVNYFLSVKSRYEGEHKVRQHKIDFLSKNSVEMKGEPMTLLGNKVKRNQDDLDVKILESKPIDDGEAELHEKLFQDEIMNELSSGNKRRFNQSDLNSDDFNDRQNVFNPNEI